MKYALVIVLAALTIGGAVYAAQRLALAEPVEVVIHVPEEQPEPEQSREESLIDLVRNRVDSRTSAVHASTEASLRVLTCVSELYRSAMGEYPGATSGNGLADLGSALGRDGQPFINADLASGQKHGFTFQYTGKKNSWSCVVLPRESGSLSYFTDQTGVIRAAWSGTADKDSLRLN